MARSFVTTALAILSVPDEVAEQAVLVTSELVTNAFQHGTRGRVRLLVNLHGDVLTITVADETPYEKLPAAALPQDWAESGRGLALVEALSVRWGHRPPVDGDPASGTEVWAELAGVAA